MLKKSIVLLVVFLLIITALAGCGQKPAQQGTQEQQQQQQPAAEGPKSGGVLRMAIMSNPPKLDPVHATDTSSARIIYQIFETLVDYDKDGNVQPLLAESWEISDDKKTYTFKLRKGVHFHKTIEGGQPTANGGREVKADDWVWTFNYILNPDTKSERAYFLDMIKGYKDYQEKKTDHIAGISKVDDYTLKIELEYPFAPFLSVLAYNTFNVLPKEDVEKWKDQFNFHPVGTGPFKFEQWVQDDKVVLSKNENYWKKDASGNQLPYLDGLEFRVVTDLAMEWTEFGLGNFEQIEEVDDPYYQEAKAKEGFQEGPTLGTYYYGFNLTKSPFKDNKALRQAFNYALDRKTLIDLVRNGRVLPATGVLPPGMLGYDSSIQPQYTFDPEKARQLLKEAGYPNGIKVELVYNTSEGHKRIAEAVQQQMKEIGIDMSLKNIDWGALLDATDRLEIPFFRMGWVADYPDPDNFLYVLLNSANIGPQGNYSGFNNKEFDNLTNQARIETDPAKRAELYKKAEAIAREEAPWLFIYHYTTHTITQPYVKNVVLPFFGEYSMKYTEVWMDK
ncbi:ABC transporter substrate-binding protein [Thermoanaerobacterium sp. DL9XJH110]|uniref:ABC transporter substrate-binding protein n=1 Tax=Thermoanaerobacterium sp. DL9XJH110 TaxID=3386643 RepID=UPI003BB5898A